ncbi:translationally-controlled tumor protein [Streptomyces sp. NPDC086838]|uniref:translationally-controlled tumor protein n=1 Tax=Streptomyces sp. NPDC086838 TaxID=3365762 RepID=UPI0037FE3A69
MKIYKDVLGYNKDELFSDAFPIEELPALYAVTARMVTSDLSVKVGIGSTGSGEGEDDGEDGAGTIQVINLVDSLRLQRTAFDRKSYLTYLKGYLSQVESHLSENAPGEVEEFKKSAQEAAKAVLADFDSYDFYQGENLDADGMVAFARPVSNDTWTFNFWKHGVRADQH